MCIRDRANTSQQDAIDVLARHQISILDELLPWLNDAKHETPAPDSDCFRRVKTTIVAAPSQSLGAAKSFIESQGVDCWVLGDAIEGDSETIARAMAGTALWQRRHQKLDRPLCLLSGGETTVKVTGAGIGGRERALVRYGGRGLTTCTWTCTLSLIHI